MGINIKIMAMIVGFLFLMSVISHIKKKSYNPSFSVLWLLVSFFLLSIPLFESFYQWFGYEVLNFSDARIVVLILIVGFLLVYNFYLTSAYIKTNSRVQFLLSHTAYLENKIEEIESKQNKDAQ